MNVTIVRNVDGERFYEAINEAMKSNLRPEFVDIHDRSIYDNMKLLAMIDDGTSGVAITYDDEIISLFEHSEKGKDISSLNLLIPVAVMNGGARMNCYGDYLAKRYMSHGFVPVARCKFDDSQVMDGWNYELNGRPDIYFLVRFTSNIGTLVKECASFDESFFDFIKDSLPYMEYDEAKQYAKEKTKTISEVDNPSYKQVIDSIVIEAETNSQRGNSL